MGLHCRPDEEPDIDPLSRDETSKYIAAAERRWCRGLCERCGLKHDEPTERCPTCNPTHLKPLE